MCSSVMSLAHVMLFNGSRLTGLQMAWFLAGENQNTVQFIIIFVSICLCML